MSTGEVDGAGGPTPLPQEDSAREEIAAELRALRRTLQRERLARREAEDLLESKSRQLYGLNQTLEERVIERAAELDQANELLRHEAHVRSLVQQSLVENEERFRSVVNNVIDGIITIDGVGTIDFVNPAAEELFGYAPGELIGLNVSRLMPAPDTDLHTGYLDHYLRTGQAKIIGVGREVQAQRRDGSTFDMELSVSEYLLDDNRMFVGIVRDTTERNQIAEHLRQAKENAEQASQAKSEFLGRMSHELRTPMSAILGYTELILSEDTDPTKLDQFIAGIQSNAGHMLALINDLLELTRIEAEELNLREESTHIGPLVEDVVALMEQKASDKGLAISVEQTSELPVTVLTDPLRFRQIAINLVGNAVKYTQSGSVVVRLGAHPLSDRLVRIILEVQDSGEGISAENLERVFEPFAQIRSKRSTVEGTGLGLSIARQIARLMGGDIELSSEPGKGSTFRFSVEAAYGNTPGASRGAGDTREGRASASSTHSHLAGLRVLLAEDAPDNRLILSRFLERVRVDVTTVDDGAQAVEIVQRSKDEGTPFDVIIMDMMMPVMDGYEATRTLRELGVATPILALTAQAMTDDRARSLEAGCDDYLTKPVRSGTL